MPERPRRRPTVAHDIRLQRICDSAIATEAILFGRGGDDAADIDAERGGKRVDHVCGRGAAAFGDEDVAGGREVEWESYCSLVIWLLVSSLQ